VLDFKALKMYDETPSVSDRVFLMYLIFKHNRINKS